RGHRCDELAAARGRIQDTARRAHPAVQVARDLLPHCLPAGLIDVAEPVLVQPLIVHANGHSYSRSWFMPTAKGVTTDMLPGTPFLIVGTIQTFLRRNHRGVKELIYALTPGRDVPVPGVCGHGLGHEPARTVAIASLPVNPGLAGLRMTCCVDSITRRVSACGTYRLLQRTRSK